MSDSLWTPLTSLSIPINTLIKGETNTHSQKWLHPSFAEYNCTIYGLTISTNHESIFDIMVNRLKVVYEEEPYIPHNNICSIVTDTGSSGYNYVYIFTGTDIEKNELINKLTNQ